jgi:hypothetical protein
VVHSFCGLITKDAGVVSLQAVAMSPMRHPVATMQDKPKEKLYAWWCRSLPD